MCASPTDKVHNAGDLSTAPTAAEVESTAPPALSLRAHLSSSGATLVVVALAVFGMFLPTVVVSYAFSDDYPILAMADGLGSSPWFGNSIIDAAAVNGRPFAGVLDTFFFSAAGTIDNLRFVRLFAVIGIVALALALHWALVRSGIRRGFAALIAVLVCSMPAFQVYGSWAVLFVSPWAALLGGCASLLAVRATDGPRNLRPDRLVGATGLLIAALLIYQPAAMFFWVFLAVALVGAVRESGRALHLVRTHFGVAAVALPLAYLVVKLGARAVGNTSPNAARNALLHDVPGKVRWFVEQPLYRSLNLFDLTPSLWLALLVATVAGSGILLLLWHRGAPLLPSLGIGAALIPLSFLPNLVVAENSLTYRTQVSLSALIALYACLGALGIWLILRAWLEPRVSGQALTAAARTAAALSMAFVAASVFFAAKYVYTLFVEPQSTEFRTIRSQVAALPAGVQRIAFVETGYDQGMAKFIFSDEFGVPSSAKPWSLAPAVLLILRQQGRLAPSAPRPVVDSLPPWTTTLPKNEPVVDVRGLQRLR
jgi:hypothetical protein